LFDRVELACGALEVDYSDVAAVVFSESALAPAGALEAGCVALAEGDSFEGPLFESHDCHDLVRWDWRYQASSSFRVILVEFCYGLLHLFEGPADGLADGAKNCVLIGGGGGWGSWSQARASAAGVSSRAGVRWAGSESRSGCSTYEEYYIIKLRQFLAKFRVADDPLGASRGALR